MIFELKMSQSKEDAANESNLMRSNTMSDPTNSTLPDVKIQLPASFKGPKNAEGKDNYYTPEHMFLAAVSGCFFTTFSAISNHSNLKYKTIEIESKGMMDKVDGKSIMAKIEQKIVLTIPSMENTKKAEKILEKVENNCPLANSTKSEIHNTYEVKSE